MFQKLANSEGSGYKLKLILDDFTWNDTTIFSSEKGVSVTMEFLQPIKETPIKVPIRRNFELSFYYLT